MTTGIPEHELARLTPHDRKQVEDFGRFLRMAGERTVDGKVVEPAPAEWHPYIKGTGPAPEENA